MQIKAALLRGTNQPFEVTTLELDAPRDAEVRVRIAASGVCASDSHTRTGRIPSPMPAVLGHEGAGIVEEVGAGVTHVTPGDHVALSWMPNCGECRHCRSGRPVLCSEAAPALLAGTLLDGTVRLRTQDNEPVYHYSFLSTFSSHVVVPAASAIKIDKNVPLTVASLMGCAVLTGFGAVVNRARVRPGSTVAIFGAGGVGLNAVMAAYLSGAEKVISIDPVENKRKAALEFGATHALDPNENLVSRIRDLTDGDGVDCAIDAVGAPGVLDRAYAITVPGGTIVCVGVPGPNDRPSLPGPELVRQEKIVTGSLYGSSRPALDIPVLARLFASGRLPLDGLITRTYELEDINEAFDDLDKGLLNRGLLIMDKDIAW